MDLTPERYPILVIGYGSTLRRDDAAGRLVAERLEAQEWPGLRAVSVPQLVPELAEHVATARAVLFVDAAGPEGGDEVRVEVLVGGGETSSRLEHAGTPRSLLQLSRLAYGRCPPAWLIAIPGEDFGFGEGVSAKAQEGIREALDRIREIAEALGDCELADGAACPSRKLPPAEHPRTESENDESHRHPG